MAEPFHVVKSRSQRPSGAQAREISDRFRHLIVMFKAETAIMMDGTDAAFVHRMRELTMPRMAQGVINQLLQTFLLAR